jgi:hypothetical protein
MAIDVTFTFNVDAHAIRQRDALCGRNGYQDEVPDPNNPGQLMPNPENKTQFAKRMTREWWMSETRKWEVRQAEISAQQAIVPLDVS